MINKKINKLRNIIKLNNIDGYIVPKNDEFFSEYAFPNRLKTISNFSKFYEVKTYESQLF